MKKVMETVQIQILKKSQHCSKRGGTNGKGERKEERRTHTHTLFVVERNGWKILLLYITLMVKEGK